MQDWADREMTKTELYEEPAFMDNEGPTDPPAYVCTLRLRDVLASLSDDELAAWGEIGRDEIERRQRERQDQ